MVFLTPEQSRAVDPFSGPEPRRLIRKIALMQLVVTLGIAAVCALLLTSQHALSALAGGLIGIIGNLPLAVAMRGGSSSPKDVLARMYVGQLSRTVLTVALLFIVARTQWLKWSPFLAAYVVTFVVWWWVPLAAARRRVRV
jgi:F0F1-type ATP synthase assembly protein I